MPFIPKPKTTKPIHRNVAERILRYYEVSARLSPRPTLLERLKATNYFHEEDDGIYLRVAIQGELARMERRGFQLGKVYFRITDMILQGKWVDEDTGIWRKRLMRMKRIQYAIEKRFSAH